VTITRSLKEGDISARKPVKAKTLLILPSSVVGRPRLIAGSFISIDKASGIICYLPGWWRTSSLNCERYYEALIGLKLSLLVKEEVREICLTIFTVAESINTIVGNGELLIKCLILRIV